MVPVRFQIRVDFFVPVRCPDSTKQVPYRRQFGASKVPRGRWCPCAITVPILRTFGAITVPNVLRRFGAKKVEMGCGVQVPKFGALPV